MDAFLPGVAGWEDVYHDPAIWHFRFHGPAPEALVQDRERIYFEHFWNDFAADKNHSLSETDRAAYAAADARWLGCTLFRFRKLPRTLPNSCGPT